MICFRNVSHFLHENKCQLLSVIAVCLTFNYVEKYACRASHCYSKDLSKHTSVCHSCTVRGKNNSSTVLAIYPIVKKFENEFTLDDKRHHSDDQTEGNIIVVRIVYRM